MKVLVIQSKTGIMMNDGASVKNQMFGVLTKSFICGILVRVIASVLKHAKLMNI